MKKYMARILDDSLERKLQYAGAVLITGPKWCGKTTTATMKSKSILNMQDPKRRKDFMESAATDPTLLLKGKTPRLIDEWQIAPNLWDAVRQTVDRTGKAGQFILTGSSVPSKSKTMHTGTGRISRLLMRPMSLFESEDSDGSVSLRALFNEPEVKASSFSEMSLERLAFCTVRGGWPYAIDKPAQYATQIAVDYLEAIINVDMSEIDGVSRSPSRVRKTIQSLARNTSSPVTLETLRQDMAGDDITVSTKTISEYLGALERMFVTEDLEAWSPALRSKTAIRIMPKRHFIDPSIACAALRASPEDLLQDIKTFGFMFESLCVRDLRVYAEAMDGKVFHYRDKGNLEVDTVIHLNDGRWAAVEIKLASSRADEAAENLKKFAEKVDFDRMKAPSFLMVLTGGDLAYRRADGVYVVPISCLGP